MRDLRDPLELGRQIIILGASSRLPLTRILDTYPISVPNYHSNEGPIEKYGDPRLIPSTMPNAVE